MLAFVFVALGALHCAQADPQYTPQQYPSQQWHPFLQMYYNGPSNENGELYANPSLQRDSYYPVNYQAPYLKPVYGPPNRNEFSGFSERYQDFSRQPSQFNSNPSYNTGNQDSFFSQSSTSQDVSNFQNYNKFPFSSQSFYNSPERSDLPSQYQSDQPSGQSDQSQSNFYDRSSFSSGPFYSPRRIHSHVDGPSYPSPPRSPERGGFNRPRPYWQVGSQRSSPMEVLYSWKQVDFDFSNDLIREEMIRKQEFIPRNNLILDMDVYEEGPNRMIFVTLPRVRPGVPVTLATVSQRKRRGANLLVPFPDWRSHVPGDCENGITSVFRTHIDLCGRLWVLDSGNNNAFLTGQSRNICPPQILIYDLRNYNQLIGKYRIPQSLLANNSLLVTINVDSRSNDCSNDIAYIADSFGDKLLVFNLQSQQFWRTNSTLFYPYPDQTNFSVNGVNFSLSGGIFGLALSPLYQNNRRLFFHCIDSVKQSYVDTADIQDPRPWLQNVDAKPEVFRELRGERSSQSAAAAMDEKGVMFFGLIGSNEMACWNSATEFSSDNIVTLLKDDRNLQFNSGIKVYRGKLYAVTNRLQNYLTNQVREEEDNYRVLVGDVSQMIRGSKCDVRQFSGFYQERRHRDYERHSSHSYHSFNY